MAEENTEANDRTEDPTPRRLEEALRRGDVVRSMEVNTWFTIAGGTLMIMLFAAPMASSLQTTFRGLIAKSYQIPTDGPALTGLMKTIAFDVVAAFGVPLLLLCIAAFAGNIVQHRVVFTTDYPFGNMKAARQFFDQMPINPADKEKIAHLNAERLLGL